ncbi:HNH endonuclease signature motif containing protein [Micromonospora humida]|uniref:HNH endonuclease signature motif containing protein n=1 Tax=Micromonospora humida TaxID=2809018 RepID=UPI00341287FC
MAFLIHFIHFIHSFNKGWMFRGMVGRKIPSQIKRDVRRRCGFGCVVCGLPLYEYDHLLGFAEVKRHLAEEITLLCDKHHRERTSGMLPTAAVVAADASPYNLHRGTSSPYHLHFSGDECYVQVGSSKFMVGRPIGDTVLLPIVIDNFAPLSFRSEDGRLLLGVELHDEHDQVVLSVVDNELVYAVGSWDIEFVGRNLVLRSGCGSTFVDLAFDPPGGIVVKKGRLLHGGVEVIVEREWVAISDTHYLIRNFTSISSVGFALGEYALGVNAGVRISPLPRRLRSDPRAGYILARKRVKAAEDDLRQVKENLAKRGIGIRGIN